MKLLAIDTATEACSAALWLDGSVHERFEIPGRGHTDRLLPMVQALLADGGIRPAQLDGLVSGVGPGSFAGVRIATGFVKGLALALDRPVVGASSLAMLAVQAQRGGATQVLAAIDARMNEVYFGAWGVGGDGLPTSLSPEVVGAPAEIAAVAAGEWVALGTGWGSYAAALQAATGVTPARVDGGALPHAEDALRLALPIFESGRAISADELAPSYVRNRVALTLVEQAALRAAQRAAG